MQWPSCDPLDMQCHHQKRSQLTWSPADDTAWRTGKGTPPPSTQMVWPCRTWRWLAVESPKSQSHRRSCLSPSKKTLTEVIGMDCLALDLRPTLRTGKLGVVDVRVDPSLYQGLGTRDDGAGAGAAYTIDSWPNPKQWVIVHTSDLMMIIRQYIFSQPSQGIG